MSFIDLHCDTIIPLYFGRHLAETDDCHISLRKLKRGGTTAQCFAIFVPCYESAARHGISDSPEEYFDKAFAAFRREMELNSADIAQAFTADDIVENEKAGRISAVLTVEDCVTLRGDISRLDDWYKKGVRMAALTWNYENSLGFPNSPEPEKHSKGLKPFGKEAVERMNELGIIVDVSHLSEGGFNDVADISRKPFVASHSCARALCDHSRNLRDAQLRAVADSGGVIGLNFLTNFLRPVNSSRKEDYHTTYEDIIRQLEYIRNVAGIEALALGSDYDGIESTMDWGDSGGNRLLLAALEKSFSAGEVEKISCLNALRVFRDVIG